MGATRKRTNNCNKFVEPGPKEAVYVLAFRRVLEKLLSNHSILLYPEEDVNKQSCDMVITMMEQKIAVEHGANLIVSPDNNQSNSIKHHVKQQAEKYHEGLHADQTWVINWTNVKMGTGKKQVQYYFPESDTVKTVYIYHDKFFKHIELVTKDDDNNDIVVKYVDRDPIIIQRQNTGESEPKRRKLNNPILPIEHQLQIDVRKFEKKKGCIQVAILDEVKDVGALLDLICDKLKEDRRTRVALRTADEKERLIMDIKQLQDGALYHALKQEQEDEY